MKANRHKPRHAPPAAAPPLGSLYVYLTEGCNLACRHCWLAPKLETQNPKRAVLPVATFRSILREAKPLGLHTVKLTGGEPLLHPRFTELVDAVRREELRLQVETNRDRGSPRGPPPPTTPGLRITYQGVSVTRAHGARVVPFRRNSQW